MKTAMKTAFLAASLAALAVPVVAQAATAAGSKSHAPKSTAKQARKHPQKQIAHTARNSKRTAGEAASLGRNKSDAPSEKRDMRDYSRARVTSAHGVQPHHQQTHSSKTISHKSHRVPVTNAHAKTSPATRAQLHRTAKLKTGQLTTSKAAPLETKEAALHHQIHSDREQDSAKVSPETQTDPQDKNTNQIHLKKHNARMF
jgi:hypothetical protein